MTQTTIPTSFALSAALVLLLLAALPAQFTQPPVEELKRLVAQREQEFIAAQAALAYARARLARAEGKRELAAAEWRKVLTHNENCLKAVQNMFARGRLCSAEPLQEAMGAVAMARAWLADVEDRKGDLLAELPKVIEYYEFRIQTYKSLHKHKAITDTEAEHASNEVEGDLQWAKERLAALRGSPARQDKTRKSDKP